MASTGGGKMRPKRSHVASKPYERTRPKSFLDRVKDFVTPSWLSSMWSGNSPGEPPPQQYSIGEPSTSANSVPLRPTVSPDGQYFSPKETERDSEPGPAPKLLPTGKHRMAGQGDEEVNSPAMTPFGGISVPVGTSTPIDVDEDVIEIDDGEGPSTQKDNVSESSAPPSVVSSLYPNLDKLEHQQKLSESNLDLLSEIGKRQSPMPSSSLWSHTPSGRSATTRARPASPFNRPQQPAITTRRPSFNASYFGTPRGSLRASSSMDAAHSSPFYAGRTTYGGASAQRSVTSKRTRTSPYEVHLPIKRSVRPRLAKPADESDMGITSNTAKRILDTLEKMSTPLADAKRIPLSPSASPLAFVASRTPKLRAPSSPNRPLGLSVRSVRIPGPPISGLNIPHTVSIAPNRQPPVPTATPTAPTATREMEEDTDAVESIESNVPASMTTTTSSGFSFKQSVSAGTSHPPPIAQTNTPPAQSGGVQRMGSGGKMKQKRTNAHYSANKNSDDDVVEVPDLPNVPLPIKSFPSFSFGKPLLPPKTTAPSTSTLATAPPSASQSFKFATSTPAVSAPAAKTEGDHEFTFASPILKQTASTISAPEFETTEAFTFSLPKKADLPPSSASSEPQGIPNPSSSGLPPPTSSLRASGSVKGQPQNAREEEEEEMEDSGGAFGIKPAKTLKTGSCLEVFGIVASKESTPTVTTSTATSATTVTDFAAKFKPPPGSWECSTCLLQNKASDSVCVACQVPKPAALSSNTKAAGSNSNSGTSVTTSNLLAKFKPPAGSWECSTCMLQNNKEADNCVACAAPKPAETQKTAAPPPPLNNTLLDKFRPPPGSWHCGTCLLENKPDAKNCVACTEPKPNAAGSNPTVPKTSTALTNSTRGVESNSNKGTNSAVAVKADASVAEKFKPPAGSWNCDTCLLQNKPSAERCIACDTPKPGSQPSLKTPPASAFKFGSQSSTSSTGSTTGGFKFGGSTPSNATLTVSSFSKPTDGFTFGSQKTSAGSASEGGGFKFGSSKDNSGSDFKFGSSSSLGAETNSVPTANTVQFGSDKASKTEGGFKFGAPAATSAAPKQDDKPVVSSVSSGFQFGAVTTKSESTPPNVEPFKATAPSKTNLGTGGLTVNAVSTLNKETNPKPEQKQGFSFGASKNEAPKLSFGSSVGGQKQSENSFTFGAKAPMDSTNPPAAAQTVFQFGASSNPPTTTAQQPAEKPVFKFGATPSDATDTTKPASVSSGFSFGGATENAVNTSSQLPHQNSVAPIFQFGEKNSGTDEAGTGQPPVKKGVMFTPEIEQHAGKENKRSFNFGGVPSQPATQQASTFVFGAADNKVDTPSKPNGGITFGTPAQSATQAQPIQPFTFGAGSTNSKPEGFNFSAPASQDATSSSGGFKFGASAATTVTSAQPNPPAFGGFGSTSSTSNTTFGSAFGAQPTTNSTPNPFGSQQPSQAAAPAFGAPSGTSVFGSTPTPAFGAAGSAGNSRSSTPTFGATGTGAGPQFGNTGSSFGTGATNSGMGFQPNATPSFNFGGSNPAPSSGTGVFTFGANNSQNAAAAPPTASTGGFSFGQQQQQRQQEPSGFGMQTSAQNATSTAAPGVYAFGASPAQPSNNAFNMGTTGTAQQRKFRRAVRRTRKT